MSSDTASVEQQLVDLLGSAASYNDKGFQWCGHSPTKVNQMQSEFFQAQLALMHKIGAERLGQELLVGIESGAASQDGSGDYATLAEQVLGVRRSRA